MNTLPWGHLFDLVSGFGWGLMVSRILWGRARAWAEVLQTLGAGIVVVAILVIVHPAWVTALATTNYTVLSGTMLCTVLAYSLGVREARRAARRPQGNPIPVRRPQSLDRD